MRISRHVLRWSKRVAGERITCAQWTLDSETTRNKSFIRTVGVFCYSDEREGTIGRHFHREQCSSRSCERRERTSCDSLAYSLDLQQSGSSSRCQTLSVGKRTRAAMEPSLTVMLTIESKPTFHTLDSQVSSLTVRKEIQFYVHQVNTALHRHKRS